MSDRAQKVLVLAPHPDDESLGCGGTINLIASAGGQVDVLFMTRGERGTEAGAAATYAVQQNLAETRTREAQAACRILGVSQVNFLEGQDSRLHLQPELAEGIYHQLLQDTYRSVFCPWDQDAHRDHQSTYSLMTAALRRLRRHLDVWLYEVWSPLRPNMVVAIDSTIDLKMEAIGAHASQLESMDYARGFRALAQYRSLLCPTARYAEAFFTCDSQALLEL